MLNRGAFQALGEASQARPRRGKSREARRRWARAVPRFARKGLAGASAAGAVVFHGFRRRLGS